MGLDLVPEPLRSLALDAQRVSRDVALGYFEELMRSDPDWSRQAGDRRRSPAPSPYRACSCSDQRAVQGGTRLHPRAPPPRADRRMGRPRPFRPPRRGSIASPPDCAPSSTTANLPWNSISGLLGKRAARRDEAATARGPEDGRDQRRAHGIPGAGVRRSRRVRPRQHQRPDDLGAAARPGRTSATRRSPTAAATPGPTGTSSL